MIPSAATDVSVRFSLLESGDALRLHSTTLLGALERAAEEGAGLRFVESDVALSWKDALESAWRVARALRGEGVSRGDRVVLALPTGPDFVAYFFGTLLAGGVPTPASLGIGPGGAEAHARALRELVNHAEARVVVSAPRTRAMVDVLGASVPVRHLHAEDPPAPGPPGRGVSSVDPSDLALLQYTSGSTSAPKGVALSHAAILSNVHGIGARLGMTTADVGVSWLPLFHDMGLIGALLTALYWRFTLHLLRPESFLFHPFRWLSAISRTGATLSVAPNFAYGLAAIRVREEHLGEIRLDRWRHALNGAEPVDPRTIARFSDRFAPVGFRTDAMRPVYGLAENCLAVTFPPPDEAPLVRAHERSQVVSVGTPLAGQKIAIADESGRVVPEGQVGEVLVGGPCRMTGYFHDDAATAQALRDGWLRTGDLGFVADGRLYIVGREKDLIIRRGRNLHPQDLERIAEELSGTGPSTSIAFGIRDEGSGTEDLVIVVESHRRGAEETEALTKDLQAALLDAIGVAADRVVIVPRGTLPRTSSGKVRRAACRDRWGVSG